MKVVYIGDFNTGEIMSGPEKVSKRIFEEYSKTDKTLFIHYFQNGKKYNYYKKLFGYEKTADVNGSEVLKLGIFVMLYKVYKLNPIVIHILCFERFVIFLYLLKIFSNVKIYYNLNGIIRHENKYYNKESLVTLIKNIAVENIIVYLSDRMFYLSELSKSILSKYYSYEDSKLSKVKNGLDSCFLEHTNIDSSYKEPDTIVFIGDRERIEKGFSFLMKSLSLIDTSVKLYIIDSNLNNMNIPELRNVQIFITEKLSPVNLIEYLSNKNIVISTSEYDPFNISVLEAISCGLYPVLTKQTGLSEFIGEYVDVSLVDYGDEIKFSQILSGLFKTQISDVRFSNLEEFSWKSVFEKYYRRFY